MQKILFLSFLILFLASVGYGFSNFYEEAVDEKIKKSEASLIFYMVPWCVHCTKAQPAFKQIRERLKKKYFVEIIDCKIYEDFCKTKQPGSFPSIIMYKKGERKNYKSYERDVESIVNWFEKNSIFFGTVLNSTEEIEKFKSENKKYVIGYFPLGVTERYRIFDYVANGLLDGRFNFAVVKDFKNIEGEFKEERIEIFNGEEEVVLKQEEIASLDKPTLSNKIFDKTFPLVSELSKELFREYRERRKDVYVSFIETSDPQQKQAYLDTLRKLAQANPQFSFAYVPYENNLDVLEEFGIPNNSSQSIVRYNFFENLDDEFFTPPRAFTFEAISEWIKEINPTIQSQSSQIQEPTQTQQTKHDEL